MSSERSFWVTFPGIATAIAALLGSLAALLPVMQSLGWIGARPSGPPTTNGPPGKEPVLSSTSACGQPASESLKYWDFDAEGCVSSDHPTPRSDFWFKANDHRDPGSDWGVVPSNGAKFAPRHPDRFPWKVPHEEFTTASGVYSVPAKKPIPCITSEGLLCQFVIWPQDDQIRVTIFRYRLQ